MVGKVVGVVYVLPLVGIGGVLGEVVVVVGHYGGLCLVED